MNRRSVNKPVDDHEYSQYSHNPFRNAVRGNIKSNDQINSFNKSKEVLKLLKNTLGLHTVPMASTSFRIPLKHSLSRNLSNNNFNHGKNLGSRRNPFSTPQARVGNSGRNDSGNMLFSRREKSKPVPPDSRAGNDPHTSAFSDCSPKRPCDYSSESSWPKYVAYNNRMEKGNYPWRNADKPEPVNTFSSSSILEHDQLTYCGFDTRNLFQYNIENYHEGMPHANDPVSNNHMKQIEKDSSTEIHLDKQFSDAYNRLDEEGQRCFADDRSGQQHQEPKKIWETNSQCIKGLSETNSTCPQQEQTESVEEGRKARSLKTKEIKQQKKKRKALRRLTSKATKSFVGRSWTLVIKDSSEPMETIAEYNIPALVGHMQGVVKEITMKKPKKDDTKYPRYFGYKYCNGEFKIVSADSFSRDVVSMKIQDKAAPWKGGKLKCSVLPTKERVVEVKVPKSISHISEFRSLCEKSNSGLNTTFWRMIGYEYSEEDDRGVYTIGMDFDSYDMIQKEFKGIIRCGDEDIYLASNVKKEGGIPSVPGEHNEEDAEGGEEEI